MKRAKNTEFISRTYKSGGSIVVVIPKNVRQFLGIRGGQLLKLKIEGIFEEGDQ